MTQPTPDVLPGPDSPHPPAYGPDDRRPRSTRPGLVPGVLLTATFVAIAVAAALTFVGLPYVVMSPGPATNILGKVDGKPLLSIEGATTYPTSGSLDFTTVSVDGTTTYTTTKASDASALKVGQCVVAVGQADDTGAVTAQRLVVSAPVDGGCSSGFGSFRRPGGAQGDSGAQSGAA